MHAPDHPDPRRHLQPVVWPFVNLAAHLLLPDVQKRQTIAQRSDVPGYYNTRQLHDGYAGVPPMAVMYEQSGAPVHEYYKDAHQTAQKRPERAHHVRYASSSEAL